MLAFSTSSQLGKLNLIKSWHCCVVKRSLESGFRCGSASDKECCLIIMEVRQKFPKSPLTSPDHFKSHNKKSFLGPKIKFDFKHGFTQKSLHGGKPMHRKSMDRHKPLKMLFNNDPLNLSALCNNTDGRESPETSSPVLNRSHEFEPSNIRPVDFKDPLNLNQEDNASIQKPSRKRKRRRRRNTVTSPDKEEKKDDTLSDMNDTSLFNESDTLISPIEIIKSPMLGQNIQHSITKGKHTTPCERLRSSVSETPTQSVSKQNFNEKNKKYKFGNFVHYYNSDRRDSVDTRLSCFKKEWFENKACLDIGCNTGRVTCLIGSHFLPQSILGVDIDTGLIKLAKKNIFQSPVFHRNIKRFPLSLEQTYGPIIDSKIIKRPELFNVKFSVENYVPSSPNVLEFVKPRYEMILCLNVTKWVQLNFGDDGLKWMFKKIYLQLLPGGRLLLEPQSYNSYKKKKNLTLEIRKNFDDMKLMPTDYIAYLLSNEVGFAQSERLNYSGKGKTGYDRPIYLLTKSGSQAEKKM
ncbi:probable RNA methyltransferase Y17G7B.18 [Hydractinia symbiolongicarpus]|uniref:probable RNA methyltransferase Y17G7B.18 n=1 Tax=Hydractinia symbiolongicarpus TaxID=13093 RepID=UPI0025512175|nr:probable RNA methyltransferase Y17G7B.18 [Hydractinia symbiolongicarpus]